MKKTTLALAVFAAIPISTSSLAQANFSEIADDRVFSEVGLGIVRLKGDHTR